MTQQDDSDDHKILEKQRIQCEKWRNDLLEFSPIVTFMLKELERVGCPFDLTRHFKCAPCAATNSGAFIPDKGILLCQNRLTSKQHTEDTIAHELIHAFDHCTAKVNWSKCAHYACSEIRAASLSGDCRWTRELNRGYIGFGKHHQACVKRRVMLVLKQLPQCQGDRVAEDAVNSVWDSCFNDTAPFDEIY